MQLTQSLTMTISKLCLCEKYIVKYIFVGEINKGGWSLCKKTEED